MNDIGYLYDGSFEGLLCCVFESIASHESPCAIWSPHTYEPTLYPVREIQTDPTRYQRVLRSIAPKISPQARELVIRGYLTCHPQKELLILRFLTLGYRLGPKVCRMLTDDTVCALTRAVRHLEQEAHLLSGFLRFCERGGILTSQIRPKNFVLPLLAPHFSGRYPEERFLIHDLTHHSALIYQPYQYRIFRADEIELPPLDEEELRYQQLWKRFYHTIGIESRYNPRCRQTQCPKRYWECMLELDELLHPATRPGELPAPGPSLSEMHRNP